MEMHSFSRVSGNWCIYDPSEVYGGKFYDNS